jgi:hypothetical protein
MAKYVPYLSEDEIERDAAALLAEFARARRVLIEPPIPIEVIVEKYLKLGIEFDDTHRLFGVPRGPEGEADILGAIFFDDCRIVIDQCLDPEENPSKEGRYRFTLAHEGGGHWRLHRSVFASDPQQNFLFGGPSPASVVCRSSQAKERVEWQADFYASCLLMPKTMVLSEWKQRFGDHRARRLVWQHRCTFLDNAESVLPSASKMLPDGLVDVELETEFRAMATVFLVSPQAMRIRLEKLGLLRRGGPHQRVLAVGA